MYDDIFDSDNDDNDIEKDFYKLENCTIYDKIIENLSSLNINETYSRQNIDDLNEITSSMQLISFENIIDQKIEKSKNEIIKLLKVKINNNKCKKCIERKLVQFFQNKNFDYSNVSNMYIWGVLQQNQTK